MNTYQEKVQSFLNCKNIAVAGVSRKSKMEAGNGIYKKLKDAGYNVYQINPNADEIDGDKCYRSLSDVPEKLDAVMIATHPSVSESVVKECKKLGIDLVWFHRSIGNGSYSKKAADYCNENDITAIESGCPMMHVGQVDFPHKCLHFGLKLFGKLSK